MKRISFNNVTRKFSIHRDLITVSGLKVTMLRRETFFLKRRETFKEDLNVKGWGGKRGRGYENGERGITRTGLGAKMITRIVSYMTIFTF